MPETGDTIVRRPGGTVAARLLDASGTAAPYDRTTRTIVFDETDAPGGVAETLAQSNPGDRILVLGWNGVHPDARAELLRRLWQTEEQCRAMPNPLLVLRFCPLVGGGSPLCAALVADPPSGRWGRTLVQPLWERDAIEVVRRVRVGQAEWDGWHEVGGAEVMSLAEVAEWARTRSFAVPASWEPARAVLDEQRLIEPQPWTQWSGFAATSLHAPEPCAA